MNQAADQRTAEKSAMKTLVKFLKFMMASGAATLLDLGLFYGLESWVVPILWPAPVAIKPLISNLGVLCATAAARICSASVNFLLNKNFVFQLKGKKGTVWKYILLCVLVMVIDGLAVGRITELLPENTSALLITFIKAGVDTVLFVFNFFIQKIWVFPPKK